MLSFSRSSGNVDYYTMSWSISTLTIPPQAAWGSTEISCINAQGLANLFVRCLGARHWDHAIFAARSHHCQMPLRQGKNLQANAQWPRIFLSSSTQGCPSGMVNDRKWMRHLVMASQIYSWAFIFGVHWVKLCESSVQFIDMKFCPYFRFHCIEIFKYSITYKQ